MQAGMESVGPRVAAMVVVVVLGSAAAILLVNAEAKHKNSTATEKEVILPPREPLVSNAHMTSLDLKWQQKSSGAPSIPDVSALMVGDRSAFPWDSPTLALKYMDAGTILRTAVNKTQVDPALTQPINEKKNILDKFLSIFRRKILWHDEYGVRGLRNEEQDVPHTAEGDGNVAIVRLDQASLESQHKVRHMANKRLHRGYDDQQDTKINLENLENHLPGETLKDDPAEYANSKINGGANYNPISEILGNSFGSSPWEESVPVKSPGLENDQENSQLIDIHDALLLAVPVSLVLTLVLMLCVAFCYCRLRSCLSNNNNNTRVEEDSLNTSLLSRLCESCMPETASNSSQSHIQNSFRDNLYSSMECGVVGGSCVEDVYIKKEFPGKSKLYHTPLYKLLLNLPPSTASFKNNCQVLTGTGSLRRSQSLEYLHI